MRWSLDSEFGSSPEEHVHFVNTVTAAPVERTSQIESSTNSRRDSHRPQHPRLLRLFTSIATDSMIDNQQFTGEPSNNGHIGDRSLVLCREVVPISEVLLVPRTSSLTSCHVTCDTRPSASLFVPNEAGRSGNEAIISPPLIV